MALADGPIVVLLRPIRLVIHLGTDGKESVLVLAHFQFGKLLTAHSLLEDGLYLGVGILLVIEFLDAVVSSS